MSTRNLQYLFRPRSVAVIGASDKPRSVGATVMANLLAAGFAGPVMPVNPRHEAVAGVLAYPDVASLPVVPELAVIATPPETVPGLIAELGARGTRAAVVITAGLSSRTTDDGRTHQQAMLDAARPHLLRIVGPNCLGLLAPACGLNASFAHVTALPGKVALVHQSGALCTGLLDWANGNGIGFSHFITVGDAADVDFGDLLDYLGSDPDAQAILLYVESIRHARKFMSAARAAARNKPVLVVKAGRVTEGARAAASHTGALAGADDVFDAAFQRAGMLRVYDTGEMFDAVETLAHTAHGTRARGERLVILTNGGGPGVIATDALIVAGGQLADLGDETVARLDEVLPPTWSHGNPVDIIGDANGQRYAKALRVLLEDPGVDAALVLHAPTAVTSSTDCADGVIEVTREKSHGRSVLTSWLGGGTVQEARRHLSAANIPTYETPDSAVRAFMHLVRYRRNQALLMETPPSVPEAFRPATEAARLVIEGALASGRKMLTETESKAVLSAYGIPTVETRIVTTPKDAERVSTEMGLPVALKVLSHDITHKSDVGGVVLDLESGAAVREAAEAMSERIARLRPGARVDGFTVQKMARRPGAHELIVGATTDPVFGPVILFGQGGTAVEVVADRAVSLPPLNMRLAREMVDRTRVARLLAGYRDRAAVDLDSVCLTLIKIAQLVTDIAEIVEIDVNPLLADAHGVLALDARLGVDTAYAPGPSRLAIRPYPSELEESFDLGGRPVLVRPIRPEDEPQHHAFIGGLDPEDIRFRFFGQVRELPHTQLARFTQIDYDREMAFIVSGKDERGQPETLGVVRTVTDPDNQVAEFAIVIASRLKRMGLGRFLLEKMIRYCRARGTREIVGQVLPDNDRMLGLARRLGFRSHRL
ncbi:MAG: GNAT family N-acetyltransferase, partial [Planctomycetes bacterium]|nr:GNAT family N-acetyltransferase [Planctomycetota bacterium]